MMDVNWFSLSSSGALIVSWAGCMKNEANLQQSIADLGGKTVEHFPHEIHLVPTASRLSVTVRLDKRSRYEKKIVNSSILLFKRLGK